MLGDIAEALNKYAPGGNRVADVPTRPGALGIGQPLEGSLVIELPPQTVPIDPGRLSRLCNAAGLDVTLMVVTPGGPEAGLWTQLCP